MNEKHTQGRLTVNPLYPIQIATTENPIKLVAQTIVGKPYTEQEAVDFARRLVACWNACEGLSTKALEHLGTIDRARVQQDVIRAEAISQRDELLAALEEATDLMGRADFATLSHLPKYWALIAKVKGGAA